MLLELLSAITTKMLYLILHIENAGSFPKPLSAKEEKKALEQMASGDTEAKNRLIEHNLRLVAHIIKKILFKLLRPRGSYFNRHNRAYKRHKQL